MMRRLLISIAAAAGLSTSAFADLNYQQASPGDAVIFDFTCFTTKHCTAHVPINSAGTEIFNATTPGYVRIASGFIASGAVASGAYASGAFASGAFASGSIASGAMVDLGTIADAAATAGSTGSVNAKLRLMTSQLDTIATSVSGAIPAQAGTIIIGGTGIDQTTVGTTNAVSLKYLNTTAIAANSGNKDGGTLRTVIATDQVAIPLWGHGSTSTTPVLQGALVGSTNTSIKGDPCQVNAATWAPISITTATTTRIIPPSASNRTYICYMVLTSAAADNVGIVEGTGGTCGTGTAGVLGGTTAANGPNFAANGGLAIGNGSTAALATAGTNVDFCLITSAATPLAGHVKYVQAP